MNLREQNLALTRFESAAWSSAVLAGGRVVKMIGDEVFFTAPTAEAACRIGTEVCRAAAEDPVLPPRPGGRGHGPGHPARGRLLRAAREPAVAADQAGAPGELVVDRGGDRRSCLRSDGRSSSSSRPTSAGYRGPSGCSGSSPRTATGRASRAAGASIG